MTFSLLEDHFTPAPDDRAYLVNYVAIAGRYSEIEFHGIRTPVVGDADLSGKDIAEAIAYLIYAETGAPVQSVQICYVSKFVDFEEETMPVKFKSIFASKTFWAVIAQFLIALQAIVAPWAEAGHALTAHDVSTIAGLLVTTALGVYGRYAAKKVLVTPAFLPGRNYPKAD